jgi:hypothetical protein
MRARRFGEEGEPGPGADESALGDLLSAHLEATGPQGGPAEEAEPNVPEAPLGEMVVSHLRSLGPDEGSSGPEGSPGPDEAPTAEENEKDEVAGLVSEVLEAPLTPGERWTDRPQLVAFAAGAVVALVIIASLAIPPIVTSRTGRRSAPPAKPHIAQLTHPASSPVIAPSASPSASAVARPAPVGGGGPTRPAPGSTSNVATLVGLVTLTNAATPAGVVPTGTASAFAVNQSNGHLVQSTPAATGAAVTDLTAAAGTPSVSWDNQPAAVSHGNEISVFTVDAANGHLQETHQPAGGPWATRDLSATAGVPPVATKDSPAAVLHDGELSVFTVNMTGDQLEETYLASLGSAWATRNIGASSGTPAAQTNNSPVTVFQGVETKVFTVSASSGQLWETWLTSLGASWQSDNLSASYGTPAVRAPNGLTAVVHGGVTSVLSVNAGAGHLEETYQPAIGGSWSVRDVTSAAGTPAVSSSVAPTSTFNGSEAKVLTASASNGHLWESWLAGGAWHSDDITSAYGTPVVAGAGSLGSSVRGTETDVFTVNASNGRLQETSQLAAGGAWATRDISG